MKRGVNRVWHIAYYSKAISYTRYATSPQPTFAALVVLDVPITLALADLGQAKIKLFDVLVFRELGGRAVQHHAQGEFVPILRVVRIRFLKSIMMRSIF